MWAVGLKETSEVIGSIGYLTSGESNLSTEALEAVIDYCFNVKGFEVIGSQKEYFCVPTCGHAMWEEKSWATAREKFFDRFCCDGITLPDARNGQEDIFRLFDSQGLIPQKVLSL